MRFIFDLDGTIVNSSHRQLTLPNGGMETLHHVHADDVAQAFTQAMTHWGSAVGEAFFVVSRAAVTVRGFAEAAATWFGKQANLRFLPTEQWLNTVPAAFRDSALTHLQHCSNFSCVKAQRVLEYVPRYSSLEAVRESVLWLIRNGKLKL